MFQRPSKLAAAAAVMRLTVLSAPATNSDDAFLSHRKLFFKSQLPNKSVKVFLTFMQVDGSVARPPKLAAAAAVMRLTVSCPDSQGANKSFDFRGHVPASRG